MFRLQALTLSLNIYVPNTNIPYSPLFLIHHHYTFHRHYLFPRSLSSHPLFFSLIPSLSFAFPLCPSPLHHALPLSSYTFPYSILISYLFLPSSSSSLSSIPTHLHLFSFSHLISIFNPSCCPLIFIFLIFIPS